ncbi:MAG TPA: FtsX-like permease family protein, partial [Vicinamibacteria bacterium]|nr:FtsX-like permease family protein [Vicinamibacteria bacterium]
MRALTLAGRSVRHYWRTNGAMVLGVATAVAVLSGSLVVGQSVRASLADLAVARLGRARVAVTSPHPFREALGAPSGAAPLLSLRGTISRQDGTGRAGDVLVYGVDERFFAFHGVPAPAALSGRAALLSPDLGAELRASAGDPFLVVLNAASDIPGSTLFGRRDEPAPRLRVTAAGTLARADMGEFVLLPTAREVRAVFVPLAALQRVLGVEGRVNTLLLGGDAAAAAAQVAAAARLADLGLGLRALPEAGAVALESASSLLDDDTAARARGVAAALGLQARPSLIYLANAIRAGERAVPYSVVAALDEATLARWTGREVAAAAAPPIVLNSWAAAELGARAGTEVALDYYVWEESGRMATRTAPFQVAAVVPLEGEAADRTLVPDYPGITESAHISDWDPPFPVDLARIRPQDEAYWERHRATPKAFVPLAAGQRLWGHRLGRLTSLRFLPAAASEVQATAQRLEQALPPALLDGSDGPAAATRLRAYGIEVAAVREQALRGARGSTDFGQYFLYFSAFLVASALLLAGLFFRLGLEQRLAEVGLLRAVGFTPRRLLALFLAEGLLLAGAGAALGTLGALAYARAIVWALRTVWVGAVGTRDLQVVAGAGALAAGAAAGMAAALLAVAWTLRDLRRRTPRALLAGALHEWAPSARRRGIALPAVLAAAAAALLVASALDVVPVMAGFFGGGTLVLAAVLAWTGRALRARPRDPAAARSVAALGLRGASYRPGRSLVCIGLVASAAFIIVAVGAFRHDDPGDLRAHDSPSGGFTLLALSSVPLHHDPRSTPGRAALGLPDEALAGATLARFRRSDGEDASCLNLYRPGRPTILGAEDAFLAQGRFAFAHSLASTAEERANPWRLLERDPGGPLPVVADATTLQYVLHARLGEERALGDTGLRVRFVGALRPGLLQGALVTGERAFQRAFPEQDGYRFFLVEAPPGQEAAVTEALESRLSDFGLDVTPAAARLRAYHQVENTYISTFQTLGALGLLLGTVGLAAVLLRNAFERRRELALLQAVGFGGGHLRRLV